MKLTEHFTLGEMTKTSHKTADGNIPSHVAIENLKRLCGWLEMSGTRGMAILRQAQEPVTQSSLILPIALGR